MKSIITSFLIALLALSPTIAHGQKRKAKATPKTTAQSSVFKMSNKSWAKSVNLNQDISKLSYEELYYLKALVYAGHGRWYTDGEIANILLSKAPWYQKLMDKRVEQYYKVHPNTTDEKAYDKMLEGTALSAQEKAFVNKIDSRMAELKATKMNGRSIESPDLCINMCQIKKPSADLTDKLNRYNFAIEQTDCEQLFNIYEQNDYNLMPNFITTDVYLQLTHMYLSYVQKYIEQKFFITTLSNTFDALYAKATSLSANSENAAVKSRADYVATYAAIGKQLLTKQSSPVPAAMKDIYEAELQNINALENTPSPMMETAFNFSYSLFRPRGHYTRNESAKQFFQGMMWAQTAAFISNNDEAVKRAATLAFVYNSLTQEQRADFEHMGDVITQLTGVSDNVSILQLASWMKVQNISMNDIDNEEVFGSIMNELTRLNASQNKLSTNVEAIEGFKINLMPQRYLADNEVLRNMVDDRAKAERAYPRGLDVFAAFGSQPAEDLLYNFYKDNEKWDKFTPTLQNMKNKFAGKKVGIGTIYDQRLQVLVNLAARHKKEINFSFYNTKDWEKKELNTSLASWSTLKHDAILYAEQPEVAECGDGAELPTPQPMGFVEPNIEFWTELHALISDTKKWLEKSDYLDYELKEKSEGVISAIEFCKEICEKELRGEVPSYEEREKIRYEGSSLEYMTLGLIDPELELPNWDLVEGADRKIALVADIFTRGVLGCDKNGILYTATGNANALYVLVKIGEKVYVTRGATYGYYEFTLPLDKPRLTDEEWQKNLENGTPFRLQEWLQPYILDGKVSTDERNFYSTGC